MTPTRDDVPLGPDPATPADPEPVRPRVTLSKAAELAGVSHSTVKRRHRAGAFPNAEQDDTGAWTVPIGDLLTAGFTLTGPPPAKDQVHPDVPLGPDPGLLVELADLRRLLALETVRREAAEQIAEEREKRARTAERALLMLEARPADPVPVAERRRWWQRG